MSRKTLAVLCALAMTACSGNPSDPTPINQEVVLVPGQSIPAGGGSISLRLLGVPSDSRCPANALCIHPGSARVDVQVTTVFDVRIASFDTHEKTVVSFGALTLELLELAPYPPNQQPIDPAEYRARLRVTR